MNLKFPVNTKHANEIDYCGSRLMLYLFFFQAIVIV